MPVGIARIGVRVGTKQRWLRSIYIDNGGVLMANADQLEAKFWKALHKDMTVMLGLAGIEEGHSQPMTVQFDNALPEGPLWFFTAKDTDLVRAMGEGHRATAHFSSKGHDLFASIHGELTLDNDPTRIDRLWNKFAAAWYQGGKDDPNLQLIRFDAEHAQIWLNENSLFAGVKILMGSDPKRDYRDKVADVRLNH
jgi:general stress protein 26